MAAALPAEKIRYAEAVAPDPGGTLQIAPGVHWLRMPLPFALTHINLWLLEDGDKFTIVDTGIHVDASLDIWRKTFADAMQSRPVERVIVTHMHPDHAGNAGWLCNTLDAELWMTRTEYFLCRILSADTGRPTPIDGTRFYRAAGFPESALDQYQKMFGMFGRLMSPLPDSYRRLHDGETLRIGETDWQVVVGNGHSPEHACLFSRTRNLLIAGDQLLPTISSNVSVFPTEPAADPLADWLASLDKLAAYLPEDVLVLPAHGRPFLGAHGRLDALRREHEQGLAALEAYCDQPRRAIDTLPTLFGRVIRDRELIMATGESIAHLNWLLARDRLTVEPDDDGVNWYRRA